MTQADPWHPLGGGSRSRLLLVGTRLCFGFAVMVLVLQIQKHWGLMSASVLLWNNWYNDYPFRKDFQFSKQDWKARWSNWIQKKHNTGEKDLSKQWAIVPPSLPLTLQKGSMGGHTCRCWRTESGGSWLPRIRALEMTSIAQLESLKMLLVFIYLKISQEVFWAHNGKDQLLNLYL